MNSEGVASNSNSETVEAITYGLGKEMKLDQIYVENSHDYKNPTLVEQLPPRTPISDNQVETVEEVFQFIIRQAVPNVPSDVYYDGTYFKRTDITICKNYTTQKEACLGQRTCGWCSQVNEGLAGSGACIAGNSQGPLEPCLRNRYVFAGPPEGWNPINKDRIQAVSERMIGPAKLTTVLTK